MRKIYLFKLIFRIMLLSAALVFYFMDADFLMIEGIRAFQSPVVLIIWFFLMAELISRLFPDDKLGMGCQKEFKKNYREKKYAPEELKAQKTVQDRRAAVLAVLWTAAHMLIWTLYFCGILRSSELLILTLLYHVGDMVCVLYWCPFQTIFMKNRCCTVCRIYNWDALFLVSPVIIVPGIMSAGLAVIAAAITIRWEYRYMRYPERFFECSNDVLTCAECKSHLCVKKKKLKKKFNEVTGRNK